jgi:16S rRNA processing protein RimM
LPSSLLLGRVVGAHGIRGELKIGGEVDALETLLQVGGVEIEGRFYQITGARPHKKNILLSLAGVETRNQAEDLIGLEVRARGCSLPPLEEGEYYWFDILGLAVFRGDTGAYFGRVVQIIPTPAHDVYVIREGEMEFLIPAVEDSILEIDVEQGRMTINPEGGMVQSGAF